MWKVVLQCLAFLLVAGIANAQDQIGASPKSTTGGLVWVYDFDSGDVAGVYLIGKAAPSTSIGFELGVGFSAVLYVCDAQVADPATETDTCDVVQTLTGDVAQTVYRKKPNRRWFLIDINTAETAGSVSTLGLDGSYMELSSVDADTNAETICINATDVLQGDGQCVSNAGGTGGGHNDGANCDSGQYPLGVNANGVVQDCEDTFTQTEANSHNAIPFITTASDAGLSNEVVLDSLGSLNTIISASIAGGAHTTNTNTNAATICGTATHVLQGDGSCVANAGGAGGGVVKVYSEPPSNILPLADYSMEQASYADGHPSIATQEGTGLSVDLHLPITGHIGGRNNMGVGFDLVSNDAGSGVESSLEPDNIMGFWYNGKIGPALVNSNPFEHSFTWRVEASYKNTDATAGSNWIEFNKDFYPPDLSCVMNAFGTTEGEFDIEAGVLGSKNDVTWSGNGTAWALDYNTSTNVFKFRMDNNTVVAANETATINGKTATCNGTDMVYLGTDHQFRGEQLVWDVEDGSYGLSFYTGPLNTPGSTQLETEKRPHGVALKLQDQGVLINGPVGGVGVPPGLTTYGPVKAGNQSALYVNQFSDDGVDQSTGGTAPANSNRGITIDMDYQGVGQRFNSNAALYITGPPPGFAMGGGVDASTITDPYAIYIADQEGFDTSTSAIIRIDSQSCSKGGAATVCTAGDVGNFAMLGGTWNTGHILLGGISAGLHIYADKTYNTMKIVGGNSRPFSDALSQGVAVVTGSNLPTHGPTFWGISNAGTISNGNELCGWVGTGQRGGVGQICQDVISFATVGTPSDENCTEEFLLNEKFLAFCK